MSTDLTNALYTCCLFWLFKLWYRYSLVKLSFAMSLHVFFCGMLPMVIKFRPSIFPLFVYCRMLLLIVITEVFFYLYWHYLEIVFVCFYVPFIFIAIGLLDCMLCIFGSIFVFVRIGGDLCNVVCQCYVLCVW